MKSLLSRILKYASTALYDKMDGFIIYEYKKEIFRLTIILFIGIFFVVRGSTAPIISHNPVFLLLFYSDPNSDKTIYNIGISVIAAYIFYIVQVYIPEKKDVKRKIRKFSSYHRQEIFLLNQYILAWKEFLKEEGVCYFHEFEYELNNSISGSLTKKSYNETIEDLVDCLVKLINNSEFSDCDNEYKNFIVNSLSTIYAHLKFMDDEFPRWYDTRIVTNNYKKVLSIVIKDMEKIKNKLSAIEKYHLKLFAILPYSSNDEIQNLADLLK